jgi:TrmH family RNA methyltransferase
MEITSVNNDLVKETVKLQQKKYRNSTGKFLIEGFKAIKEAFDFGIKIEYIFVDKSKESEYEFAKEILIVTSEKVLKKLATTDSAPEAVAVAYQKKYDLDILKTSKKVVLLENIKDLGNLGTIIRTSVAFGADSIILYGSECADLYNPKCVRATVGQLWKLPIVEIKDINVLKSKISPFERIATLPRSKNMLKNFVTSTPFVVMFGSEADGLSKELIDFSTNSIKIEMKETVESLNLATSVAVVLYELFV